MMQAKVRGGSPGGRSETTGGGGGFVNAHAHDNLN